MLRRLAFLLGLVGATTMGAAAGPLLPDHAAPAAPALAIGCPAPPAEEVALRSSGVSEGAGVWAAAGGRLIRIGGGPATAADTGTPTGVVVRHVVGLEGVGTAFVEDGAGTDTVVLASASGIVRILQRAEAVNPALAPDGDLAWSIGSEVHVRDSASGRIARYPVPSAGTVAFSPVFVGRGLVVVVSAAPTAAVPEGERLNDLWRLSPEGRWRRATSFTAGPDRWTAVRTPIAAPGGGVDFVLTRGRGSATIEPRSWLMHLQAGRVDRLRRLEQEMYLAGLDGQARLWNVPNAGAARVDLARETGDGEVAVIGCGATLMDPIDVPDPDRTGPAAADAADPRSTSEPGSASSDRAGELGTLGILVGDFSTAEAADSAAATIRAAGGIAASARMVEAIDVPNALRPGAFAVLVPLAAETEPRTALAAFRATLPAYASSSWVVTA